VDQTIRRAHGNTFDLAEGIPAVLVQESELEPVNTWYGLGDGNYYLIDTDIISFGFFTLDAGVHLKFTSGHSFMRRDANLSIHMWIEGDPDNPVIFDSEVGTPGTWGGFFLSSAFTIENLIVKNGGEFIIDGASERANIISATREFPETLKFENCTISNSAGWGIVVESNTVDLEYDVPAKNNMFSNNASGDVLVKP